MLSLPTRFRPVGLHFEQTPTELLCEDQWGTQMVGQCSKAISSLHLHVPGTVTSLTKLLWRLLNNDKSRKIQGHLKYYINYRISVFSATNYLKISQKVEDTRKQFLEYNLTHLTFDRGKQDIYAHSLTWWQSPVCTIMWVWVVSEATLLSELFVAFVHWSISHRITLIWRAYIISFEKYGLLCISRWISTD